MLALTALAAPIAAPACDDGERGVTAVAAQAPAPPAQPVTPVPPRAPKAPRTPSPAEAPTPAPEADVEVTPEWRLLERPEAQERIRPRGWFGFAFQCDDCNGEATSPGGPVVWKFASRPRIYTVELGSPAAHAGLRRGDVITQIDGHSILSPEGGRRFGATVPGQSVRWTVLRDGETRAIVATAIERPGDMLELRELREKLKDLDGITDMEELQRQLRDLNLQMQKLRREELNRKRAEARAGRLRYAGTVGDAKIEVRGSGSVIVSETRAKNKVVINLGESVVVVQLADTAPKEKGDSPK
jgi:membrane-associated protease RseP (regulator of RpoE activity)